MTVLAQHLDEYLQLRRTLGHKLADAHRLLPRFVTYLDEHDVEFVTIEAALAWSFEREVPVGSVVPAHRMMAVRGFARYLSGIDPRTEVPPAGTIRHPQRWRRPFIYTDADVLAMIEQARVVIPQPLRSATYQTLIGLLATTGLRVGEALRLDRGDLDRSEGVLRIRESKFGKVTARAAPRQRRRRARALRPHPPTAAARPEHRQPVRVAARNPRDLRVRVAGAPQALRARRGRRRLDRDPEIHDHRHSFAVKTLLGWYQDGVDVPSRIAWLSTYLGHREPRYTYHYLSAAPDLLAHAARLLNDAQAVRS